MTRADVSRDEADLVRLCLAGDKDAFDGLISRHYRGIHNMIYRMLGNSEDAADLTQETFLRLTRGWRLSRPVDHSPPGSGASPPTSASIICAVEGSQRRR